MPRDGSREGRGVQPYVGFRPLIALAIIVGVASPARSQARPPVGDGPLPPGSVERIERGLQRRETLQIPAIPTSLATFRVEVTAKDRLETALDAARRDIAAYSQSAPTPAQVPGLDPVLVQVDLLRIGGAIVSSLKQQWRDHAERRVRQEIAAELAVFCEVNDCAQPPPEGLLLPKDQR